MSDDDEVRSLFETMVQVHARFALAGAVQVKSAVVVAQLVVPDVVVVDLEGAHDPLALLARLRPVTDAVIVVMSEFPDPHTLLAALARGAHGYIDRGRAWAELLPSVLAADAITSPAI